MTEPIPPIVRAYLAAAEIDSQVVTEWRWEGRTLLVRVGQTAAKVNVTVTTDAV